MLTTKRTPGLRMLIACLLLSAACTASAPPAEEPAEASAEVLVLGMIHSGHLSSRLWGLDQVRETIRRIDPDVICAEIPPDRWPAIEAAWRERGEITDERIRVFPEYTEVLLPLMLEMDFEVAPCAAWTAEMAAERREKLRQFETEERFAEQHAAYERENAAIEARLAAEPIVADDPHVIHTGIYDRRTEEELGPYDHYLNEWIGAGGWTNINEAHFALIEETIRKQPGKRILITFGAGHKYWFLDALAELEARGEIDLVDVIPYLPEAAATDDSTTIDPDSN